MPLWGWVNLLLSTPVGSTWHGLSFSLLSLSLAVICLRLKDQLPRLFTHSCSGYILECAANRDSLRNCKQSTRDKKIKKKNSQPSPLRQHVAKLHRSCGVFRSIDRSYSTTKPIEAACRLLNAIVIYLNNRPMWLISRGARLIQPAY